MATNFVTILALLVRGRQLLRSKFRLSRCADEVVSPTRPVEKAALLVLYWKVPSCHPGVHRQETCTFSQSSGFL